MPVKRMLCRYGHGAELVRHPSDFKEQYLLWGMPGVAYDQAFSPFSKAFCKCAVRPIRVTSGLTKKRAYEMPEF